MCPSSRSVFWQSRTASSPRPDPPRSQGLVIGTRAQTKDASVAAKVQEHIKAHKVQICGCLHDYTAPLLEPLIDQQMWNAVHLRPMDSCTDVWEMNSLEELLSILQEHQVAL